MKRGTKVMYKGSIKQYQGRQGVVGHTYLDGKPSSHGEIVVDFESENQQDLSNRFRFMVNLSELDII